YKDYNWMMDFVEAIIEHIALTIHGKTKIKTGGNEIDFERPWPRIPMFEAIENETDKDLYGKDEEELREAAQDLDVELEDHFGKGKIIDEIFGKYVEPNLIRSEEHTSELQSRFDIVCRLLLEKKK